MEIQPQTLAVPLHKKSVFSLWFVFGCIGLAALAIKASRPSQWLTAAFVLGPAFWIALGGPMFIYRWQHNSEPLVRGLVFALRMAFLLLVHEYVVPFVVMLLDGVIHV